MYDKIEIKRIKLFYIFIKEIIANSLIKILTNIKFYDLIKHINNDLGRLSLS